MFKRRRNQTPHRVPSVHDAPHYDGQLDQALSYFAATLGASDDYRVRVVDVAGHSAACLFIETVCDPKAVERTLHDIQSHEFPKHEPNNLSQYVIEQVLTGSHTVFMTNMYEIKEAITTGNLVLVINGMSPAVVVAGRQVEHRSPEQPIIEASVRGPQISFVENLNINIGLLRTYLNTDTLHIKKLKVGYRSRRDLAIAYLGDVANPLAVETIIERIIAIHIDSVTESSAIEQRIVDHRWTPFPLTRTTQRIDSCAREINQGKIAIIVDGDPNVLKVPATIQDFFQTAEDYTHTFYEATFIRWLRIIAFLLAGYLPALYIAFTDYSPELLPKVLGLQIAKSREGVPFPAVIEVLIMQVVVEILREATLRMPRQMGQTIGIVGGLVVGEASVQAGLVSNVLIIVIALTAVSVFVSPSYEFATVVRLGNFVMIASAAVLGLYGVILSTIWVLYEVSALKSFGISYMDPFNGEHFADLFIDGVVRLPVVVMDKRTNHLHPQDDTGEAPYRDPKPHPQLETASNDNHVPKGRKR